jgi:hypothetical protein
LPISPTHPLRQLFHALTERSFSQRLGWPDAVVTQYVANLLTDFSSAENLYRIRDVRGKRLAEIGPMLLEADLLLNAGSLEREREVHRHIGDFTLFMLGVFPEYLKRIRSAGWVHHSDFLIDYVRVGRRSYANVSEFAFGEYRELVPLFKKLADNFELCVMGLGYVRDELERLRERSYEQAQRILLN